MEKNTFKMVMSCGKKNNMHTYIHTCNKNSNNLIQFFIIILIITVIAYYKND
jgi:hypothetical protein